MTAWVCAAALAVPSVWAWRDWAAERRREEARLFAGRSMLERCQREAFGLAPVPASEPPALLDPADLVLVSDRQAAELAAWARYAPRPLRTRRWSAPAIVRWREVDAVAVHRRALDALERATTPEPFGHPPSGRPAGELPAPIWVDHTPQPLVDVEPSAPPRPRPARLDDELARTAARVLNPTPDQELHR